MKRQLTLTNALVLASLWTLVEALVAVWLSPIVDEDLLRRYSYTIFAVPTGTCFSIWLISKFLGLNSYQIVDSAIVRRTNAAGPDSIPISDIVSWTDFPDRWTWVVPLTLKDGRTVQWSDPLWHLRRLLRTVAKDRMVYEEQIEPRRPAEPPSAGAPGGR